MTSLPPAIILAAGESSRFWPLSTHGHKALHRICGKAVIEHTVESLATAGVTELVVLQSPIARAAHFPHRSIADQLGDGSRYGVSITYLEQTEANGPGPATRLAIDAVQGEFFTVWPESINAGLVVNRLWESRGDAVSIVAGKRKRETWQYGVFAIDDGLLTEVVEKPEPGTEPSQLCRTALELHGPEFAELVRAEPEHEFSNIFALQKLARQKPVRVLEMAPEFFPLKYPWDLFPMADYLREGERYAAPNVTIHPTAKVSPDSVLERDVTIGPGVELTRCLVGAGSTVESSLSHSVVAAGVHVAPGVNAHDSAVARGVVTVDVKGHTIDTAMTRLGVVIGQSSRIESGVEIAAGTLIGAEVTVSRGTRVTANIPDRQTAAPV